MTTKYDAAYQGTRGANSEDACIDLLSPAAKLLPCDTLEDVFNAVSRGESQYGVVPVENTLAGSIIGSYDLLFEHDLKIVGETVRHILFALIALPGVRGLSALSVCADISGFVGQEPDLQGLRRSSGHTARWS